MGRLRGAPSWTSAIVAGLLVTAISVYALAARSADATASQPAIAIVSSPKVQTLEMEIAAKVDAKTQTRRPTLVLGTARFSITVTNTGRVELDDVKVAAPLSSTCNRRIGTLGAGASVAYSCVTANVGRNYTNTATASGRSAKDGRLLQARTAATVKVKKKPRKKRAHAFAVAFTG